MTNKTVSVYINAYNAEKFIEQTVNSILAQTYKNLKVVVIDDCSTDSTVDLLKAIKDDRLFIYSLPTNSHIAYTLNEGLKYMDGDYIAHCDADDLWQPEKIEKQVNFLENHSEYGACFTHTNMIDTDGKILEENNFYEIYNIENRSQAQWLNFLCNKANHLNHSTFLARKEIIEKVGKYDLSMPSLHDFDYWMRLVCVCPIWIIEENLVSTRIHSDNNHAMDMKKTNSHDGEYERIVKKCISVCPENLFLEAFEDDLFFKGEHTREETEIEKALVLSKIHTPAYYNPVLTVEILAELINDRKYYDILVNKFGLTPKRLNELQKTRQYHKPAIENALLEQVDTLNATVNSLNTQMADLSHRLFSIEASIFWRITKFPRAIYSALRNYASKHRRLLRALILTKSFIRRGPAGVRQKLIDLTAMTPPGLVIPHTITKAQRKYEESYVFDKNIKISILVPLYNTPQVFLKEMIESVSKQTYKNWELCLADGSTDDFGFVGKYCKKLAEKDKRIKYEKLVKNEGISKNTNHCLSLATGDYIALFDHDDYLHPSALFEVMQKICEGADYIYTDEVTFSGDDFDNIISCHFKPDFAPDNLIANNYICHFSVFKASLVNSKELFRTKYDGSQDHDLILRLTDKAKKIEHIPKVLYFWRSHANSVALDINSKKYAIEAGINAVHDFLQSKGFDTKVESSPAFPTIYRIKYKLENKPKVSIIIPNKDHFKDLSRCLNSITELSTYDNYEIIIVDNQSSESNILDYYNSIRENKKIKVISYDMPFNYSAINNFAVQNSDGEYLLFLNNDTKVITPEWIEELLMYAQRTDVGAVGAKLYYENDTVQHAGIILKIGADRIAGHSHCGCDRQNCGYMGKLYYSQDVSAVTAACMMVKRNLFDEIGGFDEDLAVAFNDIDFCLKLRSLGKLNIFNAFCELYHYESISRGSDKTSDNQKRFKKEKEIFLERWSETVDKGDPYYNPNFSLDVSYLIDLKKV